MSYKHGDLTVGDIGVAINCVAPINIDSITVKIIFRKPSDAIIEKNPTSVSGYTATYVTEEDFLDEAGEWFVFLRNDTTGYYFKDKGETMTVRPKPEDMWYDAET